MDAVSATATTATYTPSISNTTPPPPGWSGVSPSTPSASTQPLGGPTTPASAPVVSAMAAPQATTSATPTTSNATTPNTASSNTATAQAATGQALSQLDASLAQLSQAIAQLSSVITPTSQVAGASGGGPSASTGCACMQGATGAATLGTTPTMEGANAAIGPQPGEVVMPQRDKAERKAARREAKAEKRQRNEQTGGTGRTGGNGSASTRSSRASGNLPAAGRASGDSSTAGLTAVAKRYLDTAHEYGLRLISGKRNTKILGTNTTSDHAYGKAIDVSNSSRPSKEMQEYADAMRNKPGVKYVIFNNRIASPTNNWAWRPYDAGADTPTARHEDHVHVSFE